MNKNSIKQALLNLLLNSIRVIPDAGTIIVRTENNDDNVTVEVEDNGIGITPDRMAEYLKVFTKYRTQTNTPPAISVFVLPAWT